MTYWSVWTVVLCCCSLSCWFSVSRPGTIMPRCIGCSLQLRGIQKLAQGRPCHSAQSCRGALVICTEIVEAVFGTRGSCHSAQTCCGRNPGRAWFLLFKPTLCSRVLQQPFFSLQIQRWELGFSTLVLSSLHWCNVFSRNISEINLLLSCVRRSPW